MHFSIRSAALEYFELAKNRNQIVECYYHLEDFVGIRNFIDHLLEGDPLLKQIGDTYKNFGVCSIAVQAYVKVKFCSSRMLFLINIG